MLTKYIIISSILLAITFAVKTIAAQCTTNGCTVCSDTELVCEGLNIVPPLEDIDGWLSIKRISLTNGTIEEIPEGYFRQLHLEIIDLRNNQLTTFNISSFAYTTGPRTIYLSGNEVVCDSNIDWLQKWKSLHPTNMVNGDCTGSGETINTYLSDKPRSLINIRLADSFRALDRKCTQLTVPVILDGDFSSPLEYRAYIDGRIRRAEINVDEEYIKVQPGASSFQVHITIKNRGENRDDITIFLKIIPKYPISHPANTEIQLENGADGCTADVPVLMTQKPSPLPDVSEIVTQSSTDDNFIVSGHIIEPSRITEKSPDLFSTLEPKVFAESTSYAQTSMTSEPPLTAVFTSIAEDAKSPDLISTEQFTSFPLSKQPLEPSTFTYSTFYQDTTRSSGSETSVKISCTGCTVDVSTLMAQKPSSLPDVSEIVTQLSTDDNFILPGHATKPSRTTDKSPSLELLSTFFPTLFTDPTTNSQTSMRAEPSVTHELRSTSEHVSFPDLIPTEQSTSFPLSKQPIEHSTSSDSTLHQEPIATSESATPVIKSSTVLWRIITCFVLAIIIIMLIFWEWHRLRRRGRYNVHTEMPLGATSETFV